MSSAAQHSTMQYRPDVDGLRAVAVVSVVLFHIREALVPGGFVGVDIFFVISGFLITSIIYREMVEGRFSFSGFYKRRIRRIAPAYFVVTSATLVVGALLMLPQDFEALGRSTLWSAFSLPNVYFWKYLDTSYFASASDQIPLLHLWSLGVEEQFYLIWPAMLLMIWRLPKPVLLATILVMTAASFALAQATVMSDLSFSYYMLPTRAGELLTGAVVALLPMRFFSAGGAVPRVVAEACALCGYGLLGWSLFALNRESVFPGMNAVAPCLGTALLIVAGAHPRARAILPLKWKPVIWVGLISYSLYLWHWPILAFVRYFMTTIDAGMAWACLAVMLVLAWLSYRFVELPFRVRGRTLSAAPMRNPAAGYAVAVLVLVAVSGTVVYTRGLEPLIAPPGSRLATQIQQLGESTKAALSYPYNCQTSRLSMASFKRPNCVIGPNGPNYRGQPRALLIGDSNAAHFVGMFGAIARDRWLSFRNVTVSSCPPIFGAPDRYGKNTARAVCTKYREAIRQQAKAYDVVILGGQWSSHERQNPNFLKDLGQTVRELTAAGNEVIIVGIVPRFPNYDAGCEQRRLRLPLIDCRRRSAERGAVNTGLNRKLAALARRNTGAHYMDITAIICPDGECSPYLGGRPIYYDAGHLSMAGSWEVGRRIVEKGVPLRDVFRRLAVVESRQ